MPWPILPSATAVSFNQVAAGKPWPTPSISPCPMPPLGLAWGSSQEGDKAADVGVPKLQSSNQIL